MADVARVLVVMVFTCVCAHPDIKAKGLFCVDPDTGKLHQVNSTWPSTTFCGNYTCKMRKKSNEIQQSTSMKVINVTKIDKGPSYRTQENNTNLNSIFVNQNSDKDNLQYLLKDKQFNVNKGQHNEDRYLNKDEINAIAEILQTVKKSDLDSIVEIYHLAQDIYKEIDKPTTKTTLTAKVRTSETSPMPNVKLVENSHEKYWYEPLIYNIAKPLADQNVQGTKKITTTSTVKSDPISFFRGPLTSKDFGRLPYGYQPASTKTAYEIYNPYLEAVQESPCTRNHEHYNIHTNVPWFVYDKPYTKIANPKVIQTPLLLPFPFKYVPNYDVNNLAYPLGIYHNDWASYDAQMKQIKDKNYPQTYIGGFMDEQPLKMGNHFNKRESETSTKNPNSLLKTLADSVKEKSTDTKLSSWQTSSIPASVLEEVRAHFAEKANWLKAFPLRKKVNLERVGKVIKMETTARPKREIEHERDNDINDIHEDYEIYVASTKCPFDTQPGFFQNGDMNNPYPGCCPQRINRDANL